MKIIADRRLVRGLETATMAMKNRPSSQGRLVGIRNHAFPRRASEPGNKKRSLRLLKDLAERAPQFTTVSSYPIHRLYTPADLSDWVPECDLGLPGEPPYTRGIHPSMYRAASGPCASSRALARRATQMSASAICCPKDKPAFRSPSISLRSWDTTPIILSPKAKSANAAWPSVRLRIWKFSSIKFRWRTSPRR